MEFLLGGLGMMFALIGFGVILMCLSGDFPSITINKYYGDKKEK